MYFFCDLRVLGKKIASRLATQRKSLRKFNLRPLATTCRSVWPKLKIGKLFIVKDHIPGQLRSRVVYKFACTSGNACYVGETTRHFSTLVREHLVSDKASHIFKHLQNYEHCRALCSVDCFHILDHTSTGFQLKIKEAFYIQRQQPSLNQQLHYVNLKLTF